jgi:hypothetical protein
MPFRTRVVVVRLGGELFLWPPTEPDDGLRYEIYALGPVRHPAQQATQRLGSVSTRRRRCGHLRGCAGGWHRKASMSPSTRTLILADPIENFEPRRFGGAYGRLAREPEKAILAHGRWYDRHGAAELRRAFR